MSTSLQPSTKPLTPKRMVRSLVTFEYVYISKHSQKRYRFPPLGVVEVDAQDWPDLDLIVSRGGGCCGSYQPGGTHYFKLEAQ